MYKKDNKTQFSNYRPISLLPAISKVVEKVILNQSLFLKQSNLLYDHQYGFRDAHSTELALLELVNRIIEKMGNNEIPISIFLDISKAFDTVDHDIILGKLKHWAGRGNFGLVQRLPDKLKTMR